ncbi:hypothetical protein NEMIN01_0953 [Nematocida minor]|uniref:uncharacterized protein n=1 Tax=Nematocida minor TaxID=1912983 RepID=UPI00221F08C6|nr:uncharacterized protein NEMIN01_0953 [Nematocida minor]KAI5190254.1 hypothetical protein NEMIN01_0953 [Nematocida minor]
MSERKPVCKIDSYSRMLASQIKNTKAFLALEDIHKIDKALSVFIVDPYLRIQNVHSRLKESTFTHLILTDSTKVRSRDEGARVLAYKRNSIHLDSQISQPSLQHTSSVRLGYDEYMHIKRQKQLEEMFDAEIRKNEWVCDRLREYVKEQTKESPHTLYLILLEGHSLLLPCSV